MAYFPDTIAAALAGQTVRCSPLVLFDFDPTPVYLWPGNGPLETQDGNTWNGTRGLGTITGLSEVIAGSSAGEVTFSLSGVPANMIANAVGDPSAYVNRLATVFLQFLDSNWQTLDAPYAFRVVQMLSLEFVKRSTPKGFTRMLTLKGYDFLAGQARPPYSYYSDRDQQDQYPDDRFCEFMGDLQFTVTRWPNF